MSKYDDLVRKLKEIFQIDRPELDFGVYRILNFRLSEITDYLENRLKAKVHESLSHTQQNRSDDKLLHRAESNESSTAAQATALKRLPEAGIIETEYENVVFTHLLTFFSRYYDSGDFISQRRYKGDTYSIPYAGEEVVLHWANKDQYYTKSGDNFFNYGFKLDDGRCVRFRLVSADTAKDNRKDNDKERRFAIIEETTLTLIDEEGEEFVQTILPVEEVTVENGDELVVRFVISDNGFCRLASGRFAA